MSPLNPEALNAAYAAYHAHAADAGRKGSGIEKAISAYLEVDFATRPNPAVAALLEAYDAETSKIPLGHEMPTRGRSTYNWRRAVVDDLRKLAKA